MRVTLSASMMVVLFVGRGAESQSVGGLQAPRIEANDNRVAAGRVQNGELRLSLWAGVGRWWPERDTSPALRVEAFGEEGRALTIPSPLVRVRAGTRVHASIRNTLDSTLYVHGLCDRPGPCETWRIAAGATGEFRFTLNQPGTFHYWAATGEVALALRDGTDSQLGGAIVVDAPGETPRDRVLVMGLTLFDSAGTGRDLTVINGRSWPNTERLKHAVGDTVRWRVVNLTIAPHAMHLHGFYFHVNSAGDGVRDTPYEEPQRRTAVTEQMPPGRTITIEWVPERAGNWLFHCHMLVHMMSPDAQHHSTADPLPGMAGLVLGIEVTGPTQPTPQSDAGRRRFRMEIDPDSRLGATPSYQVQLAEAGRPLPRVNDRAVPGPILLLRRGEPVAVEVVNRLSEPTSIHWHGIELESYDDGVAGFGGTPGSVTPPVMPGASFVARFTPPRAGTFIYHTHWEHATQLSAGLYGPLIVLEPGQNWDPVRDHIIVLGLDGAYDVGQNEPFAVNGEAKPGPLDLQAGIPHRLRFINITADNVALTVQLLSGFDPIRWKLLAKDGADVAAAQRTDRDARQLVSVGETYDFELAPMAPRPLGLWMELRRGNGEMLLQWPVRVR